MISHAKATSAKPTSDRANGRPDLRLGPILALFALLLLALALAPGLARAAGAPEHPFLSETPVAQPRGLATDSAGDLFLAREKNPAKANKPEVTIYDPSLHEITSFEPAANAATPVGVATDSAGNVYVQGKESDVVKYVPTPAGLPTPTTTYAPDTACNATGTLASGGAQGVAVNPANDQVLVSFPDHISSYQSDCTPISEAIGSTVTGANYTSVAVRGKNGRIFAYDNVENEYKVLVFNPAGSEVLLEIDGSNSNAGAFSTDGSTVAIDQPSGHIYVSDILGTHNVVDEFDAAGEFVTEIVHFPPFSTGTAVKPNALALAPAGAPNAGNVYLVSNVSGGGGKFSAFGPLKAPSHPFLSETPVAQPRGLATDSAGDLFLAREKNPAKANKPEVTIYDPSLHEITSFEPAANAATPVGVATDSAGNVYVQGKESDVVKYVPTPAGLPTPTTTYAPDTACNATGTLASGGAQGVAVNPANDQVLVSFPDHISSYQSDCTPISEAIGSTVTGANYTSVAVRGKNGRIFAYDNVENEYKVLVFNPAGSEVLLEIDGSNSNAGAFGTDGSTVAIDQPSGHIYVSDILGTHNVVDEFDAAGEFVTEIVHFPPFSTGTAVKPNALALAPAGAPNAGNVYLVSNVSGGGGKFSAFGPLTYAASFTLKVGKQGTGTGTVSSSPAGIACGATCEAKFEEGTEVTLTATVDSSSGFASWSGCDSVVGNECKVTVAADTEVIATFVAFTLKVEKAGNGKGTVASAPAGISCGASCKAAEANFAPGTVVTLTAAPEPGSKLKAWSGCASSSGNECTLTMSAAREVVATFSAKPSIEATIAHPHDTSATLTAEVNPNGEETTYQFEYLSEDEYQANGESFSGAIEAPASPASIGEGSKAVFVAQHIGGLVPETAYRYRFEVSNALGGAEASGAFVTYSPPLVLEPCPANEEFRSGPSANLPDCRAYEQASPVHKNGSNAQGTVQMAKASINGDAVTFESAAGVPGGEGAQELPTYLASRGAGGWSTQGLLPPPSTGQGANVLGWTPDFSQVFDRATQFGVGSALLARSSAGGALTTIAPYTPHAQPSFEGASSDGSKVFFRSDAQLLPEAAEGRQNLYAWARGGALRLASVLPDGSTPLHGSLAGVSAGYNQDNHAVASDGSSIYFTEFGTERLFLRLNPTAPETAQKDEGNCVPDPVLACTVQVNASEKENGGGLHGHDAAGPRPATFMNATPDGSVAFFTSPEKLTDGASTGPEPTPPAIARANLSDGSGTELGFLPARAQAVEAKGGYLYWANPGEGNEGEGSIGRAKLNGPDDASEVEEEFVAGLYDPQGVAVDAQHVYWTEAKEGNVGEGTIGRADLPTNPGDPAANVDKSCIAGASNPRGVDLDSTYAYWANAAISAVGRADITGDCSTANSSANQSFYVNSVNGDIAVNAIDIYFSFQGNGQGVIRKTSIDGTGVDKLVTNFPSTQAPSIALDGSHLYWSNSDESKIGREDLDTPAEGCGAAVDSHGDLFVNDNGTIFVYDPSGAPIVRADLGFRNVSPCQIAVDSQGDLYVVQNGGAVTKFAPSNPGSAPTSATTFAPDPSIGESSPGANDGNGIIASGNNYAVAVDPSNDDVYAAAASHVSEYHPDGTLVTDTIGTGVSGPEYRSVAVYGQNHNVYVGDHSLSKAYVFAAADLSGPPLVTIDGSDTPAHEFLVGPNGVGSAVDQSNGHLYLFDERPTGHTVVNEFDASGAYVSQLSNSNPFSHGGVALDDSGGANDGDVYLVTQHAVDAFGPFPHQRIASLSHGSIDQSFIAGAGRPQGLAVDASHLYWSANQEVQPNPGNDLYRFDASAPAGERLTDVAPDHNPSDACPGTGGTPCGAQVQGVLGASEDGSYLYYVANGVPDGGVENSPNANGEEAELGDCKGPGGLANSGTCNLYLYHEGATTFIARLDAARGPGSGDVANWVPLPGLGQIGQAAQKTARLSADGRTLLFRSDRQLSAYDNEGASELYRYQVGDAGPNCVTCNPTGTPPGPGSGAALGSINAPTAKASAPRAILSRNLSAEGNRVFFETADALVAADTDGDEGCPIVQSGQQHFPACQDVYEWEAKGTGSCNSETQDGGCLYLLSTGKSTQPSFFADASASGDDVFIFTPDRLVRQDEDELVDVYDVSAGGGLASQNEVPPVPCEGEACKEGTPSAPPSQSAGSASFSGSGNPKPRHKKPRKRHRHHAKKRHHHHRAAKTTRRASR